MKMKFVAIGAVLVLGGVVVSACEEKADEPSAGSAAPKSSTGAPATVIEEKATLPDFTAMGHQEAQDTAQAIGFYNLREVDASGQARSLAWDRNWIVCEQDPFPGLYATDREITLYSVKVGEVCP